LTVTSVKEQVKKLVEVQAIDAEIYRIQRELKERPAFLEELKNKFEVKKENLKALEAKSKNELLNRKSLELELQTKEGEITKANTQLSSLKTNREYQAKLTEIENIKADRSLFEEKILISYDATDAINKEIETEKKVLSTEEGKYLEEKKQVDASVQEMGEQLKLLLNQRSQLLPAIEKSNLSRYERILENKVGLAIVPVAGNSCGGCFMNVPDQVVNEMKMHERLIACEMCSRILYLEEDL